MKSWIASFGSSTGTALAATCCVGPSVVIGGLSAMGLGFFINDAILLPLIVLFLGTNLWTLYRSSIRHGQKAALILAAVSAPLVLVGLWVGSGIVALGVAGIFTAAGLDLYYAKSCGTTCSGRVEVPQKTGGVT